MHYQLHYLALCADLKSTHVNNRENEKYMFYTSALKRLQIKKNK